MLRLLVVSNEPLNKSSSNGRTMANLLAAFAPSELAQFYIHGAPDLSLCANYYRVSDRDALAAFKSLKPYRKSGVMEDGGKKPSNGVSEKKYAHSCRNMVLRDIVWKSFRWWNRAFDRFLDEFAPTAVLLQAGDAPFMFRIARKIAKKRKLPLFMYNSEGYVLKEVLYSSASHKDPWHNALQRRLRREYRRFMKDADFCFYITEYLEACYQEKYPHPGKSCALYTPSDMTPLPDNSGTPFRLVYCGNLGVGRVAPLCEVAQVLGEVDTDATLDIYGRFVSPEDEETLCAFSNVRYFGVVPYAEIPRVMSEASMLLHCENPERLVNLRHAFSTKIADSLASGRPFLVYASREYPFVQYLERHNAAHIAESEAELKNVFEDCFSREGLLTSCTPKARELAQENHNKERNASQLRKVIEGTICK